MAAIVNLPATRPKSNGASVQRDKTGATVTLDQAAIVARIPTSGDFDENLAEYLSKEDRNALADRLKEYCDTDLESRKDWEEIEKRGLQLMGLAEPPEEDEGDAHYLSPGKHKVRVTMLAEAITHFQSRASSELFPPTGPVKGAVVGEKTREATAQAQRIEEFGNHYFTVIDEGYYPDSDQMLMYLPQSGSVFRKCAQNWTTGLPELRYRKASNIVVPYSANTLEDAGRYCDTYTLTGLQIRKAMERGMFLKVELKKMQMEAKGRGAADKSDFRMQSVHEDDALYDILEYYIDLELPIDPLSANNKIKNDYDEPTHDVLRYVVVVETSNREILMVRRHWRKADPLRRPIRSMIHHKFFPGIGFYGWGYPHLMGRLQKAASDGVNALLDSGFAANFQGGFATEDARAAGIGGELVMEHGKWKPVKGTFEELSKALWSPDFKPPSPALAQLVEKLVEMGQRFANTTETAVGDADNKGPVGTTLALIEQSNIVPTAIHKRLHFTLGLEFKVWAEHVHDYLPPKYEYTVKGETQTLRREDFDGRFDIVPVSDPNIWSHTQRLTLAQTTIELQNQAPDLYGREQRIEAHRRMLQAMRVPDMDAVAPVDSQPKYLDPIAENGLLLMMAPVRAFEPQDHEAHMAVHAHGRQMLMGSMVFMNMEPDRQRQVLSGYDAHMSEHLALGYRRLIMQSAGIPLPPLDESGMQQALDPEMEAQITAAVVSKLPPPPPPAPSPDDDAAAIEAKTQAAIKAKDMEAQAKVARDTEAFVQEEARKQEAHMAEMRRIEEKNALEMQNKSVQTEAEIARKDVAAGADIGRKDAAADQQRAAKEADAAQKRQHAEQSHEQGMRHGDDENAQGMHHSESEHRQAMEHLERDHQQLMQHSDADHEREDSYARADHDRDDEFARADHERETDRAEADHMQARRHKEREGSLKLKQSEQSGKLKIQQARAAAKAKKPAKKKAAKS